MADEITPIGFSVDTSGIERANKALDELASKGSGVDRAIGQVEGAVNRTGKSLDTLGRSASGASGIDKVGKDAQTAASGIAAVGAASERGAQGVRSYAESLRGFGDAARQAASSRAFDPSLIERTAQAMRGHANASGEASTQMRAASSEAQRVGDAVRNQTRDFAAAEGVLKRYVYQLGAAFSAGKILGAADEWGQLTSRLQIATGSIDAASDAMGRLMTVANRTYQPVGEVSELFIRTTDSLKELGYESEQTLGMVEALSYGLTVSAAQGQRASSVIDAWTKAMLRGRMYMDEFGSVIAYAPRLLQALANSLDTTQAGLMRMVLAGELTADKMMKVTSELEKMGKEADLMPVTIRDAFNRMTNSLTQWAGSMNEGLGVTRLLTGAMGVLADNIGAVVTVAGTLVSLKVASWLGALRLGTIAAAGGFTALAASVRAALVAMGPIGWVVTAIGAALTAWELFGSKAKASGADTEAGMSAASRATATGVARMGSDLDKLIAKYAEVAKARDVALTTSSFIAESSVGYEQARARIKQLGDALAESIRSGEGAAMLDGKYTAAVVIKQQMDQLVALMNARNEAARQIQQRSLADLLADPKGMSEAEQRATQIEAIRKRFEDAILGETDPAKIAAAERARDRLIATLTKSQAVSAPKLDQISAAQKLIESLQRQADAIGLVTEEERALAEIQSGRLLVQNEAEKQAVLAAARELDMRKLVGTALEGDVARRKEQLSAAQQAAKSAQDSVRSMHDEARAREIASAAGVSLAEATAMLALARAEENLEVAKAAGMAPEALTALRDEIDARRELVGLVGAKEAQESARRAAQDAATEWQRTAEDINRTLTDALMRGFEAGKGFARNLRDAVVNMFQTLVLRPVLQPIVGGMLGAVGIGASGSAMAAGGGSGLLSAASGANSLYGALSGGMAAGVGTGIGALGGDAIMGMLGAKSGVIGAAQMGSTSALAGGAIASAGAAFAGEALNKFISSGYRISKGMDVMQTGATLIAAAINPIAGVVVGAVSGALNALFGRKLKDSGIEGEFSSAGFAGQQYEYYKGGLFRSDKTKRRPLDDDVQSALGEQFQVLQFATVGMADALGASSDAVLSYTDRVKISLKKLTEDEAQERIAAEFARMGEAMAALVPGMADFARRGETSVQTLTRLSMSLMAVNQVFDMLGLTLANGMAGGDFASTLLDAMGGGDALGQAAQQYFAAYYTEAERVATVTRQTTEALAMLGLAMPESRDGFRALVEAAREAGDPQMLASLLRLAPAFASVTQSTDDLARAAEESARSIQQAAQQAAEAAARAAAEAAAAVARERYGLETQLLQEQGDTAALRERELATLDASNRALQQQIWALQDARTAQEAAASAARTMTSSFSSARNEWERLAESIYGEIRRIRGDLYGPGATGYAQAQAQFAITTAQARAGDERATALLPELSRTLLTLAEANATTLVELQRIRGQTAGSLLETTDVLRRRVGGIPMMAAGTNYVPRDMLVGVHEGEAVVPRQYNPAAGGNNEMLAALRNLDARLARIEASSQSTSMHSERAARVLDDAQRGKAPLVTESA